MKSKRIESLDIAKGIGIFLVVFGHFLNMHSYPGIIIYSFHMPLFFFISGMCFNACKYVAFNSVFISRLKTILWPCICFTAIVSILQCALIGIPLSDLKEELPGALWFLPILFLAEMIYYPLCKIKSIFRLMLVLSLYFICLNYSDYLRCFPYKISFLPKAILYYTFGHSLKNLVLVMINDMERYTKCKHNLLVVVSFFLMSLIPFIEKNIGDISSGFLNVIFALFGIYTTFLICTVDFGKLKKYLLFLGENTLVIMAVHVFFMRMCIYYVHPLITHYFIYKLIEFVVVWCLSLLSVVLIDKYAPQLKRIK